MPIGAGFARSAALAVTDEIFVAAAIRQTALIVPAAPAVAEVSIRAARASQAGRSGRTADIATGVGLGAA
jgi:hypothetical protein